MWQDRVLNWGPLPLESDGLPTALCGLAEKPCVEPRGHSFDPKFMKVCQNINPHKI